MPYPIQFILAVLLIALTGCANNNTLESTNLNEQNQVANQEKSGSTVSAVKAAVAEQALPPIEPKADEFLKQMGDFLASKSAMSFQAIVIKEQVLPTGQKLQYDANVVVKMRRPDGLYAEAISGAKQKRFWFNGRSFSLLDFRHNLYATTEAPSNIDDALDYAMAEYGVSMPLSDFVFADPYSVMSENNLSGFYVALTEVNGVKTHHLAFRQPNLDWQIWVNAEGDPTPRKFVISYHNNPSVPQFIAFLKDWDFQPELKAEQFIFVPPAKAAQIEFSLESVQLPEEVTK